MRECVRDWRGAPQARSEQSEEWSESVTPQSPTVCFCVSKNKPERPNIYKYMEENYV